MNHPAPTWRHFMDPAVTDPRYPLELVAQWWAEVWEWREVEVRAGRGNPYDWDPSGRVSRGVLRTKFPFLARIPFEDEARLVKLVQAEARRRKLTAVLKTFRRYRIRMEGR